LPIAVAYADSFWIICKVNDSVFHSLEISGFAVHFIEHAVFPADSGRPTQAARALISLKLASIVGILDEKLHVFRYMNVYDDGCIVLDVELQVVEILNCIA
jgi:hypothetical protein